MSKTAFYYISQPSAAKPIDVVLGVTNEQGTQYIAKGGSVIPESIINNMMVTEMSEEQVSEFVRASI